MKLDPVSWDLLWAGAILGGFLLLALLVRLFWIRLLQPHLQRTAAGLDDSIVLSVRRLVVWGILLLGLYSALTSLRSMQSYPHIVDLLGKALGITWVLLAIWTFLQSFNAVLRWYVQRIETRSQGARDVSYQAGLIGKMVNVLVMAFGLLYILRLAGVDISPLLASGAIGGLAVALALQDTLANLFAGLYLTLDRPARVGDFIKLESGQEGYVEEIGWRHTQIRVQANNVVVIPNTKLSQAVITNYSLPYQDMSLYVACGVSYESDLEHVEAVTLDVARAIQQSTQGADPDWEPTVRWKEFADSAITFVTVLRVKEFRAQQALQSAFMKALHRRFQEECIEIPYPVQTVLLKSPALPQDGLSPMPGRSEREAVIGDRHTPRR